MTTDDTWPVGAVPLGEAFAPVVDGDAYGRSASVAAWAAPPWLTSPWETSPKVATRKVTS